MFAVTRPSVLKFTDNNFFNEYLQKIIENLFKSFYLSFGTTASGICLVKRQGFASSVPVNGDSLTSQLITSMY